MLKIEESKDDHRTLFVSDAEIGRRLGVGEDVSRRAIRELERNGFPKKDPLFANKRYWPAVLRFFNKRYGILDGGGPYPLDGVERSQGEWPPWKENLGSKPNRRGRSRTG